MADSERPDSVESLPAANQDPSKPGAGGFNLCQWSNALLKHVAVRGRVDYNFNQSTKLYVSYNHQHDSALNSLDVLWAPVGNSWAAPDGLPIPHPWSNRPHRRGYSKPHEGDQPHSHQRIGFQLHVFEPPEQFQGSSEGGARVAGVSTTTCFSATQIRKASSSLR